jgi:predicted transporter
MTGAELVIDGVVALVLITVMVKGSGRRRRAAAAAAVAEVGTSPFSLLGRVLVTAGVIVGVQWFVITRHADNTTLLWVVLAVPALVTAVTLVRLLTLTVVNPPSRRSRGRR